MPSITVVLHPEPDRTHLLMRSGSTELVRAQLPVTPMAEPRALTTLLEGLSLAFEQRLSVVLVVDEADGTSCGATYAALVETRPLFYDVGIVARGSADLLFEAEAEGERGGQGSEEIYP
ncbi:MAG: hypothetical protein AAFU79_15185 [Myxococcota bacterium]